MPVLVSWSLFIFSDLSQNKISGEIAFYFTWALGPNHKFATSTCKQEIICLPSYWSWRQYDLLMLYHILAFVPGILLHFPLKSKVRWKLRVYCDCSLKIIRKEYFFAATFGLALWIGYSLSLHFTNFCTHLWFSVHSILYLITCSDHFFLGEELAFLIVSKKKNLHS